MITLVLIGVAVVVGFSLFTALLFRKVVSTNEVHIVQSRKHTTSYGKDTGNGNTYYQWPAWLPLVGINKIVLPVSVFDLDLKSYDAYDKGRLPFVVDVKAFFRISDSNIAAQRVASFKELQNQLQAIVQGAVRVVLASNDIEEILQGRSTFGEQFTKEVREQLTHWGVEAVKNIELMDIRDSETNHVIKNIMEKKKSLIEMESRQEVAKNRRQAEIAETDAVRDVEMNKQSAAKAVGLRTAEANKEVEVAKQATEQAVKDAQKLTKEKEMAVLQVQHQRTAEINKNVVVIQAQQNKETAVINAEASKETALLVAEGSLEAKKREATGITVEGEARASAAKALQLAPVEAQIVLAKEIGANESYQKYLVTIKQLETQQAIGIEQAKALEKADVKIISNTGDPVSGINDVRDLFSSSGGTKIGAMLEGFANTEVGGALLKKSGVTTLANGKGN